MITNTEAESWERRTACGTGECGGRWKLTGYEMCWDCPGKWRRELRLNEVGQNHEEIDGMKDYIEIPREEKLTRSETDTKEVMQ